MATGGRSGACTRGKEREVGENKFLWIISMAVLYWEHCVAPAFGLRRGPR